MVVSDFRKATLQQLMVILMHDDCPLQHKCIADSELNRRMKTKGIPPLRHV